MARETLEASAVGIDLGLKDLAALSTGTKIEALQFYRGLEPALARSQCGNKPKRVKAIRTKITNRRKDFLHKCSTELVRSHAAIFIDDVSSSRLVKTGMANPSWTLAGACSPPCCDTRAMTPAAGCETSMKPTPRRVLRLPCAQRPQGVGRPGGAPLDLQLLRH